MGHGSLCWGRMYVTRGKNDWEVSLLYYLHTGVYPKSLQGLPSLTSFMGDRWGDPSINLRLLRGQHRVRIVCRGACHLVKEFKGYDGLNAKPWKELGVPESLVWQPGSFDYRQLGISDSSESKLQDCWGSFRGERKWMRSLTMQWNPMAREQCKLYMSIDWKLTREGRWWMWFIFCTDKGAVNVLNSFGQNE